MSAAGDFWSGSSYLEGLVGLSPPVKGFHVLPIQLEGFGAVLHRFLVLLQDQVAQRSAGGRPTQRFQSLLRGHPEPWGSVRSDFDFPNTYCVQLTLRLLQSSQEP